MFRTRFKEDILAEFLPPTKPPRKQRLIILCDGYRKCSKRRILGHSAQATSLLPIAGTMKCSHIARGFSSGGSMGSVADLSLPYSV
jgi:hypothetical protein